MTYTDTLLDKIKSLKSLIENADAIVIGAGAGLSTAMGFTYSGKRFHDNFLDFEIKYGFHDMYTGGFYPYSTKEEFWAYWSRYIFINRYTAPPKPTYNQLFDIVKNKNYFVITTNVDHLFQKSGFDKSRLFYTQGDYGLFQCSVPCHNKTYDNEEIVKQMVREQYEMKIPSSLIPKCPICGEPMTTNLRCDDKFVEDDGWHIAKNKYEQFLNENKNTNVLYLELGVGENTPIIIKYPFWRFTQNNKKAHYVSINNELSYVPNEIGRQSLIIKEDIATVLDDICTLDTAET